MSDQRDDAPTGMPEDEPESTPLGVDADPEERAPEPGEDAMPGIASEGDPPSSG
jgi:hypothetical protein